MEDWVAVRGRVLDALVASARPALWVGFWDALWELCAEVFVASDATDLLFVGRSLELVQDALFTLLRDVRHPPRLHAVPLSARQFATAEEAKERTFSCVSERFEAQLAGAGVEVDALARGEWVWVDCVAWGTTFANVEGLVQRAAEARGVNEVRARYVGVAEPRGGWWEDAESGGERWFVEGRSRVVMCPSRLWRFLAETSPKTTESHRASRWGRAPQFVPLDRRGAEAVRLAVEVRRWGESREGRRDFARRLARRQRARPWVGPWVGEVLRSTQPREVKRRRRSGTTTPPRGGPSEASRDLGY